MPEHPQRNSACGPRKQQQWQTLRWSLPQLRDSLALSNQLHEAGRRICGTRTALKKPGTQPEYEPGASRLQRPGLLPMRQKGAHSEKLFQGVWNQPYAGSCWS